MRRRLLLLLFLLAPAGRATALQQLSGQRIPLLNPCAATIQDAVTGTCLQASSVPALGALYPLTSDLCVDPASGWVGLGTTTPTARLTVSGTTHAYGDVLAYSGIVLGDASAGLQFSSSTPPFKPDGPMITMFESGFSNPDRMVLAHSPSFSTYGLMYDDSDDAFSFQRNPTARVLEIDLNEDLVQVNGTLDALSTGVAVNATSTAVGVTSIRGTNTSTGFFLGEVGAVEGEHHGSNGVGVKGTSLGSGGIGVYGYGRTGLRGSTWDPSGYAVLADGNSGATGTKFFVQPHPRDPGKQIRYVSLEGNEAGTYFRGTARLVGGIAVIDVPEDFRLVTEEAGLTVQVTPLGDARTWLQERSLASIVVRGDADVEFDYLVNGVRRGFAGHEPIGANERFIPRFRGEAYARELPDEVRDLMVQSGLLNPDYTPNEATAGRMGWTLVDRPED